MSLNVGQNRITCGEYLSSQRRELAGITDLSAHGALDRVEDCLCNIYAVSYQMHFERIEPPSKTRGPAEYEPLDRQLVDEMASGLKNKAHVFQDIMKDPWKLGQAMVTAQQGNGFPLIEAWFHFAALAAFMLLPWLVVGKIKNAMLTYVYIP